MGEDRRTGRGKAGHGLKVGVDKSGEDPREEVGKGAEEAYIEPGEGNDEKPLPMSYIDLSPAEEKEEDRPNHPGGNNGLQKSVSFPVVIDE